MILLLLLSLYTKVLKAPVSSPHKTSPPIPILLPVNVYLFSIHFHWNAIVDMKIHS